jgi:NodT family efflux transporter outer membrane factor (OMF) lipoprotein
MLPLLFLLLVSEPATWWTRYNDPELNRLIDQALANNLDLQIASQRIAEARTLTTTSRARLSPEINALGSANRLRGGFAQNIIRIPNASGQRQSGSFVTPFDTGLLQSGLDMKWELDLFGGNRAALGAADADLLAEGEHRADLAITISAEAARYYIELRGIEDRLALTRRNIDTQRDLLGLTEVRVAAGLATALDSERQRALLANTEATVPALEAERTLHLNRLAVLTGQESFGSLPPTQPLSAPALSAQLPSELLKRRPDVRAAEARLAAATSRLKQARTDLYPKIFLNGLVGRQGTSLTTISLGSGNFFNIGPQIQLPILNSGRIKANISANEARLEQARLSYRQELLTAFEEAANAIASFTRQREREVQLNSATASANTSLSLASELQRAGLSDGLAVLDSQRTLLDAQYQLSTAHTALLLESVALYKALAGGWPE